MQKAILVVTNPIDERLRDRDIEHGNVCTVGTLNVKLKEEQWKIVSMAGSKGDFLIIFEIPDK
jgi:hypothetical protein